MKTGEETLHSKCSINASDDPFLLKHPPGGLRTQCFVARIHSDLGRPETYNFGGPQRKRMKHEFLKN